MLWMDGRGFTRTTASNDHAGFFLYAVFLARQLHGVIFITQTGHRNKAVLILGHMKYAVQRNDLLSVYYFRTDLFLVVALNVALLAAFKLMFDGTAFFLNIDSSFIICTMAPE